MPEELPLVATMCTAQEMLSAMFFAWRSLWNETPSKESLCVLLAQWALETGRGKACWCWNIGNFKHVGGDGRNFTYYRCNEIIHGKTVWYDPSVEWQRPYCCFRAYRTIKEGVIDYLASLRRTFTRAWPDVLSGNPEAFAHDLRLQGYYTASEEDYVDPTTGRTVHGYKWSVHTIFHEMLGKVVLPDLQEPDDLSEDEKASALNLVTLTSREIVLEVIPDVSVV